MANFIGRLGVLLGLDSAEFQKGLAQASRQLDTFVDNARTSAALGATAFAAMAYQAMQLADEIVDTAKANDIAVDSVLKLRNALAMSGGEAGNAGRLLSSFTANIDKAAEGSFEVQKTLKGLGVSLQDLGKMSIDQLLTKSLEGLSKIEDPLTRNAKAMELFGKAAKGVDFEALNQELSNGAGVTEAQAKAIEDAADAYDNIAQAARDFNVVLVTQLGPSIKAIVDYLGGTQQTLTSVGKIFKTVFETVTVLGANVAYVFSTIAAEISHTFENAKLLAKFDFKGAREANEAYDAKMQQRRRELDEFERRVMGGGARGEGFVDPRRIDLPSAKSGAPLRSVTAGVDKEALAEARRLKAEEEKRLAKEELEKKRQQDLMVRAFTEQQRQIDETNRLVAEQDSLFQRGNLAMYERQRFAALEVDRNKEMLELVFKGRNMRAEDLQLAQELKEVEWKRQDAIRAITADQTLDRQAREDALKRENQLAEKAIDLAKRRNELTKQTRQGTLSEGFFKAMADAFRNASTEFERGQQVFQSVMGNMESAIDNFVRTGKFAFKDFAASVIRDLIAIQMKAQAIALINMGLKAIGFNVQLPGRAAGGPVSAGSPYIVGERGPELFMPSGSGTIIPNNRLAAGGTTNVTNNYINAIDVKSFETRLLESSNTIWAGYQYANKQLASNGRRA